MSTENPAGGGAREQLGRVVLVTGGNRGIGLAIARAFAAAGDQVAVTHRSQPVEGFLSVRCDVTSGEEVDAAFARVEEDLGPVEILVSNAGINADHLLLSMKEEAWSRVIDANLTGAYRVTRRAVPKMIRARRGRIILISSVVALAGSPGQTELRGLEGRSYRLRSLTGPGNRRTGGDRQRGDTRLRHHRYDRGPARSPSGRDH